MADAAGGSEIYHRGKVFMGINVCHGIHRSDGVVNFLRTCDNEGHLILDMVKLI